MRIKHYANIDDKGKLILANRDSFYQELKKLSGKRVYLVVDEERPTRSNEQLRYWFGVCLKLITEYILETEGHRVDVEEMHEYYVQKGYFGQMEREINGELIIIHNRSRKVNTLQFKEVIDRVQKEWALRGLNIPDPNQVDFINE